ncbi:TPA: glycosyltransferase family 2 protein [Clostridium perfringens]|nr:glycosyltransferase family 2 protein [Clostridium perfringens]EJT6483919.1 glycosyltransferase family 2 protein [Clostridium perfringens]MDM0827069.1 glycosyltransferase family A protein [Clostridium perfringens]MDM0879427.1 glycosyltransferase family A protein [Clostridium perfringens]BDA23135.1 glycosyl transferase [Clostridium perfringens]
MARVTVFIPVYNAEKYLKDTIDSILNQTFKDFELLLINDGSTDKSVEIIESFNDKRIRLVHNEKNMGLPFTRNRALEIINSEYIALMDSDDIAHKDRLKEQVKFLDENNNIDVVGSDFIMFFPDGKKKYVNTPNNPDYIKGYLMFGICIANPSTMLRNEFIKNNNLKYRDNFFVCQDYSFWVDVCKFGRISNIKKPLLKYRTGHENISKISSEKKAKQRAELLNQIHIRALKNNGFNLNKYQLKLINKIFGENNNENIYLEDLLELRDILQFMYKNNRSIKKDEFKKVILNVWYIACRKSDLDFKKKLKIYLSIKIKNIHINFYNINRLIYYRISRR